MNKQASIRPAQPIDLEICVVLQAFRDVVHGNGHSATARQYLMDDCWVRDLNISPETAERIRALAQGGRNGSNHKSAE